MKVLRRYHSGVAFPPYIQRLGVLRLCPIARPRTNLPHFPLAADAPTCPALLLLTSMPLPLPSSGPTLAIRRDAFERAGLTREMIDSLLNLTDDEFRVEGALIAIGPLPQPDDVPDLIERFEDAGLVYFDDFMEIPGGLPDWLEVFVRHR